MKTKIRVIASVFFILFYSSCTTIFKFERQKDIIAGDRGETTVIQHAYQPLYKGNEPKDYGMYTYVLMRKNMNVEERNTLKAKRLKALLESITDSIPIADRIAFEKRYFNLFLYPSNTIKYKYDASYIAQYNFNYSIQIVDRVIALLRQPGFDNESKAKDLQNRLIHHDGPFLISMQHPYNLSTDKEWIFFSDLSNFDPNAINSIVSEYKKQVKIDGLAVKEFNSIRLNILNVLLKMSKSGEEVYESFELIKPVFAK